MSALPSQPDSTDSDELVAYLDGELSADGCRRVEKRLANDADYRRRLTELEQAWSALEALPATVVADDFARTTIEMVAVAAEREAGVASDTKAAIGRRQMIWKAAGAVALVALAFVLARALVPSRNHALIADLPVIAQLDVLTEVGDVDYLRGLAKLDFESVPRSGTTAAPAVDVDDLRTYDERRVWVESLPANQKAELAAKFDRFEKLSPAPAEQDRLRRLESEIETASDRQELEETLTSYSVWLQARTQGEKVALRDRAASTSDRLAKAKELLKDSQRDARRQLSLEDEKALQDTILGIVEERRDEVVQEIARQGRPNAQQRVEELSTAQVALFILWRDMQNPDRRRKLQDRLVSSLSPEAQDYLDGLDNRQRMWRLLEWVNEALAPKFGPKNLEQYFTTELTDDQRAQLLGMPYSDMEKLLQQMYMRSQFGMRDDESLRRFWRGEWEGRGPRDRERGRDGDGRSDDRGPRDGRRRENDRDRFDGPPPGPPGLGGRGPRGFGPGGPGGPNGPGGRPLVPPPGGRGDWGPPRDRERPPEEEREEPI
jgi:hypothetical protein